MYGSDPWPHSVLTRTKSSCSAFCSLSSPSPPKWILSGSLFSHWPSMCFCARISIRCFSSSHARVCNNFFSPVLIKPYARFLTLPNIVNCNSSGNKGNLGAPNLPGQGCSFHSFRTNTYKLSFMESPSGIKVWQSSWFVQTLSLSLNILLLCWLSRSWGAHPLQQLLPILASKLIRFQFTPLTFGLWTYCQTSLVK